MPPTTPYPLLGTSLRGRRGLLTTNYLQVRHYAGDVVYHTAKIVEQTTKVAEVSWLEMNN